jgi:hypothetical protein
VISRIFRVVTAFLVILVTVVVPAASLGFGFGANQGETNDQRSELETTEHFRATLSQLRRSSRSKLNPVCDAGIYLGHDQLPDQFQPIVATQHYESSTDGWTSPLRI